MSIAPFQVHDLEKTKRQLEQLLVDQKSQMEELEDGIQLSEDARLRLEVNLQAAKAEMERAVQQKDNEAEEKRRQLIKQVKEESIHLAMCFIPPLLPKSLLVLVDARIGRRTGE